MPCSTVRILLLVVCVDCLTLPGAAQSPALKPVSQPTESKSPSPSLTLQTYSRMVTLEVVVKDSKGNHVTGLKPEDFQLFEQTPSKSKAKREQKIASFREISVADLRSQINSEANPQTGVYSNAVAPQKDSVPPTIILLDGLNTELEYQVQVHAQSVKMLAQLPSDVPVAVFLLGFKLEMVQDFTSDPKLLQAAVKKAISTAGHDFAQLDPRDDPHLPASSNSLVTAPSSHETGLDRMAGGAPDLSGPWQDLFRQLDGFETFTYRGQMDTRVRLTANALEAIAQHMSGYPGRKNLLWISTAFPICIDPAMDDTHDHAYERRAETVANALSDSKIAVYPINPAGVRAPVVSTYNASSFVPVVSKAQLVYAIDRQAETESRELDTMHLIADDTGGEVCTGDNDIADCVHRTVDDSSKFYEIAYYPDSKDWNGEYRKIVLDTKAKGLHLEYRQGYFANREPTGTNANDDLQRAACEGPLDATAIFLAAKNLPPDPKETMKFYLMINPAALTFTASGNGNRELNLRVGVCTFDETGKPLHYMSDPVDQKLTQSEYESLIKSGLPHMVAVAGPKPAAVRLAVMDQASGKVGSVFVKTDSPVTAATASSSAAQKAPQAK